MKLPETISDAPAPPQVAGTLDPEPAPPAPSRATPDITEVYKRHGERIYRFCRNYLRNDADAQDAAQETFVRLSLQLHRITGDVGSYATAIARNVCYDHRRYNPDRCVPIDNEERADPRQRPEHMAVERHFVDRLLVGLNRNDRVLLAHAFAGFSYEEISGITGMSAKAVSVAITRARQRARRLATVASIALLGGPAAGWLRRLVSRSDHAGLALATGEQAAVLAIGLAVALSAGTTLTGVPHDSSSRPAIASLGAPPTGLVSVAHLQLTARANSAPASATAPQVSFGPAAPPPLRAARPVLDSNTPGPQDAVFTGFTPAPQSSPNQTIFATGSRVGCSANCPVLFESQDAGRSWRFVGSPPDGTLILPPAYPTDAALFIASGNGLERSDDGGGSFHLVAPIVGPAAAAPGGLPGAARIVVVGAQTPQLWVYSESGGAIAPGPELPVGLLPDSLSFVDAGHFVVVAHDATQNAPGLSHTSFVTCTFSSCATVASFTGYTPGTQFATPVAAGGMVVAFAGSTLYASRDGGQSFHQVPSLPGPIAAACFFGPPTSPQLLVAYNQTAHSGTTSSLAVSGDGGTTFTTLPKSFSGPTAVLALGGLADGHVLAYVLAGGPGGISGLRCSTTSARSWAWAC